jgi:hypothetical protein
MPFLLLFVFLSLTEVAAQFDFNEFAPLQNQRCKPFQCQKGYEPVPKKSHAYKSTGCNAMGGGAMALMGDDDGDEKPVYESCCHFFHACHQICGSAFRDCEKDLQQCVQTACRQKHTTDDNDYNQCLDSAQQHVMMLQLAGCKQHLVQQNRYCACTTKYGSQHVTGREESLRNFYKLHVPKDAATEKKVKELIQKKKADTAPKLAKLLVALVQKYPNSIEIQEDPQTKIYRQMFGGFGGGGDEDAEDGGGGKRKGGHEEEDMDDFDVDEDLGSYSEEEEEADDEEEEAELLLMQAELLKKKAEKLKAERNKKKRKMEEQKKKSPPPRVDEIVFDEDALREDEYNQYEEL